MSVLSDLRRFIQRERLLPDGARVVIGVSGGPDSLALLHALQRLAPDHGWQLHAAYLHHGLRPEADDEARFVRETAAGWGIGCTVERADVRGIAAQPGVSLEEAARQLRYAFLARVAVQQGATIVAVGHNADDQAETLLMHLLRGSGLAGLRGMLPATPLAELDLAALPPERLPPPNDVQLVRPWLETPRTDILAYCAAHDLHPRHDATNTDAAFFRNRLRHEILPALRQINPRLIATLGRTAQALQGDYDVLLEHRQQIWRELARVEPQCVRFDLARFRTLPRGDQRALLRHAIARLRPDLRNINWPHTEPLIHLLQSESERDPNSPTSGGPASGGPYPLVAGLVAILNDGWLDIAPAAAPPAAHPQIAAAAPFDPPGHIALGPHWQLIAEQVTWPPAGPTPWESTNHQQTLWLPLHIPRPWLLRPRLPGDRMRPFGLHGSKAIPDLMTELKLPRAARANWPLLVAADGEILWLVGLRASERSRIDARASAAWELRLIPIA